MIIVYVRRIQTCWNRYRCRKTCGLLLRLRDGGFRFREFVNQCCCLIRLCRGEDGSGLKSGILIDMLVDRFFSSHVFNCRPYHKGESDLSIDGHVVSLKKITGKSTIAMNWSKNKNRTGSASGNKTTTSPSHFQHDIMILNLQGGKWWKKPKVVDGMSYHRTIPRGIYLVDCFYWRRHAHFRSNNKTNTLIDSMLLYRMLVRSLAGNLWVPLPESDQELIFDVSSAFRAITLRADGDGGNS